MRIGNPSYIILRPNITNHHAITLRHAVYRKNCRIVPPPLPHMHNRYNLKRYKRVFVFCLLTESQVSLEGLVTGLVFFYVWIAPMGHIGKHLFKLSEVLKNDPHETST